MESTQQTDTTPGSPSWEVNNPYLHILAPRFFNNVDLCDWSDLPRRVVRMFRAAEERYGEDPRSQQAAADLHALLQDGAFLPNSPVMMNSELGTNVNLFACHVLAPPSSAGELEVASRIHDGCGGIGYDFSALPDPVSMTQRIERETAQLNPGRKRKAHSAVTLHVDHPMIGAFVGLSSTLEITHTNVELDAAFFEDLEAGRSTAAQKWTEICGSIYSTGRPAIAFGEHKALRSPNGERLILNVCGESLLRENESSLIGSINASRFIIDGDLDEAALRKAVGLAVRCLDNLHDIQDHASPEVAQRCQQSRKIGLSVMGYADALLLMGLRYGTREALDFARRIMELVQASAVATSEELAMHRGSCDLSLLRAGQRPRRNASLMAIAANGTLSLLANVSGGIEPVFSYVICQNVEGQAVHQMQPTLRRILQGQGLTADQLHQVTEALVRGVAPTDIGLIPQSVAQSMVRAHDLSVADHIATQATFQSFIDGGISKTINLPATATVEAIGAAILSARASGCVGISLYRDGSVIGQPSQMSTSALAMEATA